MAPSLDNLAPRRQSAAMMKLPRLAVRALIHDADRLLVVNAFPAASGNALWCVPGGGVEPGESLAEALAREVAEETGLAVTPGALAMVSQFTDPGCGFHQVELLFHATVTGGALAMADPTGVVHAFRWVTRAELASLPHRPNGLTAAAFDPPGPAMIGPLDQMVLPR